MCPCLNNCYFQWVIYSPLHVLNHRSSHLRPFYHWGDATAIRSRKTVAYWSNLQFVMTLLPPARPRCDDDSPWIKCSRLFSWSNRSRVASVGERPKLHDSRPRKDFTLFPLPRCSKSPVKCCYGASSEMCSLIWVSLFLLQVLRFCCDLEAFILVTATVTYSNGCERLEVEILYLLNDRCNKRIWKIFNNFRIFVFRSFN
jgi:hypothetical protein